MRFHWQKLFIAWHTLLCIFFSPCEFYVYFRQFSFPEFFHTTTKKWKSGLACEFIRHFSWLHLNFMYFSITSQFSLPFTQFNEHEKRGKRRRKKNQITRRNVIKILLFSHCDLFSFSIFYFRISLSLSLSLEHVIKKDWKNIFQNKCVNGNSFANWHKFWTFFFINLN